MPAGRQPNVASGKTNRLESRKSYAVRVHGDGTGVDDGCGLWSLPLYPEKKAYRDFFGRLVAVDTNKASELWKPRHVYRMSDFAADWGPGGYYGPVKRLQNHEPKAPKQSNSIEVHVALSPFSPCLDQSDAEKSSKNPRRDPLGLPSDKSLSFRRSSPRASATEACFFRAH